MSNEAKTINLSFSPFLRTFDVQPCKPGNQSIGEQLLKLNHQETKSYGPLCYVHIHWLKNSRDSPFVNNKQKIQ